MARNKTKKQSKDGAGRREERDILHSAQPEQIAAPIPVQTTHANEETIMKKGGSNHPQRFSSSSNPSFSRDDDEDEEDDETGLPKTNPIAHGLRSASLSSSSLHQPIITSISSQNFFMYHVEKKRTLWQCLRDELKSSTDQLDYHSPQKVQRIHNFLRVPRQLESLIILGIWICLDSFLFLFTVLPIRTLMFWNRRDLLQVLLIAMCSFCLLYVDGSQLYHTIRGQAILKLYVIFNVLEICDKLCSSFGHDIMDSLMNYESFVCHGQQPKSMSFIGTFFLTLIYLVVHSMVLFYQVVTLNVAINSHNNALLTLLLSNQFVEIKGSVFKRFEKENLFQLSCSDCVERFQLIIFLVIVAIRNLSEASESFPRSDWRIQDFQTWILRIPPFLLSLGNDSFQLSALRGLFTSPLVQSIAFVILPPVIVYVCEVIVDSLKHAFIVKFNGLDASVYQIFYESLLLDVADAPSNGGTFRICKRIGFVPLPLACLAIRNLVPWLWIFQEWAYEFFKQVADALSGRLLSPWISTTIRDRYFFLASFYVSLILAGLWAKTCVSKTLLNMSYNVASPQNDTVSPMSARIHQENLEKVDRIDRFTMFKNRIV